MQKNACTLAAMLDALAQLGAPHAVFGGLLAGYYGRSRPTEDVDLLVPRSASEALRIALLQRGYDVRQFPFLTKMYPHGQPEAVGDFVVVESNAVLEAAFSARVPTEILGLPVSIVRRGAFVALKFEAAVRTRRPTRDRALDVRDIHGVLERGFGPEDEQLAVALAGRMYRGAVADLASLLDDLKHGRWPKVAVRAEIQARLHRRQSLAILRGSSFSRHR